MARTRGPYSSDEDRGPYVRRGASLRGRIGSDDWPPDPREFVDEPESPQEFLRARKRVPVRRGPLPRRWRVWLVRLFWLLLFVGLLATAFEGVKYYALRAARFRIQSRDDIEFAGTDHVSRDQVLQDVFGGEISRNIFSVPLAERRKQLEAIPWVRSAEVMRLLPNRLRVVIRERTPIAFVALGSRIALIDANGVVMEYSAASKSQYSFPVIVGVGENDPPTVNAARMKIYVRLVDEMDEGGAHYSQDLSEVNLADPDDVRVTVAGVSGAVLLHLGSDRFRARYELYLANVQKWRQSVPRLYSVDLRSDRQVIVNPDARPVPHAAQPAAAAVSAPAPGSAAEQGTKPAETKPKAKGHAHRKRPHK